MEPEQDSNLLLHKPTLYPLHNFFTDKPPAGLCAFMWRKKKKKVTVKFRAPTKNSISKNYSEEYFQPIGKTGYSDVFGILKYNGLLSIYLFFNFSMKPQKNVSQSRLTSRLGF